MNNADASRNKIDKLQLLKVPLQIQSYSRRLTLRCLDTCFNFGDMLIFLILTGFFYGFTELINLIFKQFVPYPWDYLCSVVVTWIVFKFLMSSISRMIIFAGCNWYVKRGVEASISFWIAKNHLPKFLILQYLIQCLMDNSNYQKDYKKATEMEDAYQNFLSILKTYEKQIEDGPLKPKQDYFYQLLNNMRTLIKQITINDQNHSSLMSLMEKGSNMIAALNSQSQFEDLEKGKQLLEYTNKAIEKLVYLSKEFVDRGKLIEFLKRWYYDDTLGTLAMCRASLQLSYKLKKLSIPYDNGKAMECFLILEDQNMTQQQIDDLKDLNGPVVIYCCPNAGFMESAHYSSKWLYFYRRKHFNIILWNYRGYGFNKGTPDSKNVRKDGEQIVRYLREKMNVRYIGIHGTSLGGMVASHVANKQNLQFLISDRSFNSVSDIITDRMGSSTKFFFRVFTDLDKFLATDYLEFNNFKLMTSDPNDQVISYMAQLQNGVARKIFSFIKNKPVHTRLAKAKNYLLWTLRSNNRKLYHSEQILEKTKQREMNECLDMLYVIQKSLEEYIIRYELGLSGKHNGGIEALRKRLEDCDKTNRKLRKLELVIHNTHFLDSQKLLISHNKIDPKQIKNQLEVIRNYLGNSQSQKDANPSQDNNDSPIRLLQDFEQRFQEKVSEIEKQVKLNQQKKTKPNIQDPSTLENPEEKTIQQIIEEFKIIKDFVRKLFNILDFCDGGGTCLSHVSGDPISYKQYLINLFVYGTVHPQEYLCWSNINLLQRRMLAIIKINYLQKMILLFLKEYRAQEKIEIFQAIFHRLVNHVKLLLDYFKLIEENLLKWVKVDLNDRQSLNSNNKNVLSDRNRCNSKQGLNDNKEIIIEIKDLQVNQNMDQKLIPDENSLLEIYKEDDMAKYLGQQLILSNGHNGIYTCNEFRLLEIQLYNAQIISINDVRPYSDNCVCVVCRQQP